MGSNPGHLILSVSFFVPQASGVSVSEEVKVKYDEIKKKKTHRYLIFFIKDEKTIAIEKIGTAPAEWCCPVDLLTPVLTSRLTRVVH